MKILLLLLICWGQTQFISINDNTVGEIDKKSVSLLLFTLVQHPSYLSISNLKRDIGVFISKQDYQSWGCFEVKLSQNSYLQEKFNIKRFPQFAVQINLFDQTLKKKGKKVYYKLRGIATVENAIKLIQKIEYYIKVYEGQEDGSVMRSMMNNLDTRDDWPLVVLNIDHLSGSVKETIYEDYLFNQNYFNINFIFLGNYNIKDRATIFPQLRYQQSSVMWKIKDSKGSYKWRYQNITQILQLHQVLVPILFSTVNQFYEDIFQLLKESSNHQGSLLIKRQIFVAVVDSIFLRQQSVNSTMSILSEVARKWQHQIVILWMEAGLNNHKKLLLGFKQSDQPPLFAFFDPASKNIPLLGRSFTKNNLQEFVRKQLKILQSKWEPTLQDVLKQLELDNDHRISIIKEESSCIEIQRKNYILLAFSEIQFQSLPRKLHSLLHYVSRVNRFIILEQDQFILYLGEYSLVKQKYLEGLYLKQKSEPLKRLGCYDEQFTCERIVQELKMLVPSFCCVPEQSMESYLTQIALNSK